MVAWFFSFFFPLSNLSLSLNSPSNPRAGAACLPSVPEGARQRAVVGVWGVFFVLREKGFRGERNAGADDQEKKKKKRSATQPARENVVDSPAALRRALFVRGRGEMSRGGAASKAGEPDNEDTAPAKSWKRRHETRPLKKKRREDAASVAAASFPLFRTLFWFPLSRSSPGTAAARREWEWRPSPSAQSGCLPRLCDKERETTQKAKNKKKEKGKKKEKVREGGLGSRSLARLASLSLFFFSSLSTWKKKIKKRQLFGLE